MTDVVVNYFYLATRADFKHLVPRLRAAFNIVASKELDSLSDLAKGVQHFQTDAPLVRQFLLVKKHKLIHKLHFHSDVVIADQVNLLLNLISSV